MEILKKLLKIMGVFILLCTSIFTIDLSSKQSVSAAGSYELKILYYNQ